METAVRSRRPPQRQRRVLRRVGSVLLWAAVVLLGAFGIDFSFANYPWFGVATVLLILLVVGCAEQRRRTAQRAREAARMRHRPRP